MIRYISLLLFALCFGVINSLSFASDYIFRVGVASINSNIYSYMGHLSALITSEHQHKKDNVTIVTQGYENFHDVLQDFAQGNVDSAIIPLYDLHHYAHNNDHISLANIRLIAPMQPLPLLLFSSEENGDLLRDDVLHKAINVGPIGSSYMYASLKILQYLNINITDINPSYASSREALDLLLTHRIDTAFINDYNLDNYINYNTKYAISYITLPKKMVIDLTYEDNFLTDTNIKYNHAYIPSIAHPMVWITRSNNSHKEHIAILKMIGETLWLNTAHKKKYVEERWQLFYSNADKTIYGMSIHSAIMDDIHHQ